VTRPPTSPTVTLRTLIGATARWRIDPSNYLFSGQQISPGPGKRRVVGRKKEKEEKK